MEESATPLDASTLQNVLGNSGGGLIPESLVTLLTVSFVILNVLGILFFVFYVISLVRKWRVQTAVLEMRKDVAEIKAQLAAPAPRFNPAPAEPNKVIAQSTPPAQES